MAVIKIILLVLLGLFLLFLLFILLALFFPFSYSVKGKGDGTFHFRINVHWLFYFLNFTIRLSVGGEKAPPKGALRILGIPLLRIPKKKKAPKKRKKQKLSETEEPDRTEEAEEKTAPEEEKDVKGTEKTDATETEGPGGTDDTGNASEKKGMLSKVQGILREMKDERNKAAIKKALEEGKKILKLVFPKKFRLNLTFSTGDPANTGKVLGAACLFPPIYDRGNRLCPDFEADKAYLSGTFSVKGYIILITLVIPAVRILLDKNVRRLIGKFRKKA